MFKIKIDTGNAAFEDAPAGFELARILRRIAQQLEDGRRDGVVLDVNGNTVGTFKLTGRG